MRKLGGLAVAFLVFGVQMARAQEQHAAAATVPVAFVGPSPCYSCPPCPLEATPKGAVAPIATPAHKPPPDRPIPPDVIGGLAAGVALFLAGSAVTVSHFATSDSPGRVFDLLPVFGPLATATRNDVSPGWASGLVLSAWAQAAGILLSAVAIDEIVSEKSPVHLNAGVSPGGASVGISGSF